MKDVHESEVFMFLNKDGSIQKRCQSNITKNMIDCKHLLADTFKTIMKVYKDNLTLRTMDAINKGTLIVYATKEMDRLPVYYPFVKFKHGGTVKVAVDISNYVTIKTDKVTNEETATIDMKKLYCLIISGFLYLNNFSSKTATVTPTMLKYCALIWAKLFCKVLIMKVGLATNRDRHDAFMYFAMKYFIINIMECPETVAEDIACTQFKGKVVNPTARYINETVKDRGIELYSDLVTFCNTMFNADITGMRGIRVTGSTNDTITFDFFIRQYIQLYYVTAGLTLASFPHFLWMIISVNNFAFLFNDSTIEPMCTDEFPKIWNEILRMI